MDNFRFFIAFSGKKEESYKIVFIRIKDFL